MKFLLLLLAGLASLGQAHAQVFAIVSVDTNQGDARFVIELDTENAPLNIGNFMMLASPELTHFRNSGNATFTNNPAGAYKPSDEDGFLSPGGAETFSISVNGNQVVQNVAEGTVATVFRTQTINPVATFRLTSGNWVHEKGPFDPFEFRLTYNNTFFRYALEVDTNVPYLDEVTGEITNGPFYDNEGTIPVIGAGTQHPYLALGRKTAGVSASPGWVIQNEMIKSEDNDLERTDIFGFRFANAGGVVGAEQRYAVAFANSSLNIPNTASSEIFITGIGGNPAFEGRHTYIGNVVVGSYKNTEVIPQTNIPASSLLIDALLGGSLTATLTSIRFETIGFPNFHPVDFSSSIPVISSEEGVAEIDLSEETGPRVLTGATPGQVRTLDGSIDLTNWSPLGQSNFPAQASEEVGFPITLGGASMKQFFRVNPSILTYPSWPSEDFAFTGHTFRFKGREVEAEGAPQVLTNFIFNFNLSLSEQQRAQIIAASDGGTFIEPTGASYEATSPFTGEFTIESPLLVEPLKYRLYFDAHKTIEFTEDSIIDRFHRLEDAVVTTPAGDVLIPDQIQEFGLWTIVN